MSKNPNASSSKGAIKSSRGMLPKHVFKRLLSLKRRPSIPQSPLPSPSIRNYPSSRPSLISHGITTPVPDILPPKGSTESEPKPRPAPKRNSPFYLKTGYATFAKRPSRPFPPPFVSTPSSSFSDPLTTHSAIRDRRPAVDGEFILGATNGDDAVFVTENYLVVNDGVGAWASKPRGHAALWSRLIGHFWGMEADRWIEGEATDLDSTVSPMASVRLEESPLPESTSEEAKAESTQVENGTDSTGDSKPDEESSSLQSGRDKDRTDDQTSASSEATIGNDIDHQQGVPQRQVGEGDDGSSITETETIEGDEKLGAIDDSIGGDLHPVSQEPDPIAFLQTAFEKTKTIAKEANDILGTTTFVSAMLHHKQSNDDTESSSLQPLLYVTNVGDSTVLVVRPQLQQVLYRSKEQWHWFDCPRQLGTNSPDIPNVNAITDKIDAMEDDLVVAVSDGVVDNLWEHEICEIVCDSLKSWQEYQAAKKGGSSLPTSAQTHGGPAQKNGMNDHPVTEMDGDDDGGLVFVARELVRCARLIAEDSFAESPFMERAVDEGLPFEGGKMDDITVAIGRITRRAAGS